MTAIIIAVILLLGGTPVRAEPISTVIGLTALIEGLGATAAVAGAIGGAIVGGVISIGISLVASLLAPHASGAGSIDPIQGAGVNSPDLRYTERQSIPYKRVIFGSAYVGGALFFEQVKPPYLYLGLLINHGQIDGIDKIWIGTNQLSFTAITAGTVLTPIAVGGQPDYPNRLKVSLRFGSSSQAMDHLLSNDFTSLDTGFRQRGIATAVFRYHFGGTDNSAATQAAFIALWGQVQRPNAFLLVRGVQVYDPRDPTQVLADETTWKYSNNATLLQAYYLTRDWGGRIPTAKIVWSKIAAAADWDDGLVGCADGTMIKRFTIDGVVTLNQRPSDVMASLLTANRGRVLESGGKIWLSSSKPQTSVVTIYDAILAGGIQYQAAKAKRDLVNKLQVRFVATEQDYQVVDGPILSRADLQASDGEVLTATLSASFTLDHRRAQRLQKAFLETSRLGRTLICRVDAPAFMALCDDEPIGNAVTFHSDLFSQANGLYLCTSVGFADNFSTIELALTEYDPAVETDWNPAVDEQPFSLANLNVA